MRRGDRLPSVNTELDVEIVPKRCVGWPAGTSRAWVASRHASASHHAFFFFCARVLSSYFAIKIYAHVLSEKDMELLWKPQSFVWGDGSVVISVVIRESRQAAHAGEGWIFRG